MRRIVRTMLKATATVGAAFVGAALAMTSPALAASAAVASPASGHPAGEPTAAQAGSTWTASPEGSLLVDSGRDMNQIAPTGTRTLVAGEAFQRKYGSYSRDGRTIVYSDLGRTGFGAQLWSMNADGRQRRQLTSLTSEAFGPKLSPNGTQIAFQTNVSGQAAIWLINADGTNAHQVTSRNYVYGAGISWNPAGTEFVATRGLVDERSGEPYDWELVTVRADGSKETALTRTGGDKNSPAWSPDGSTIVFSHITADGMRAGQSYELYSMKANGTALRRLTRTASVGEQDAVFSPTGTAIVYASWAQSETMPRVVKAKTDGTGAKALNATGYPTSWS